LKALIRWVRVGEKVKAHGMRSVGLFFLNDERYADPPSSVGGLGLSIPVS
jgi:hypothetical protein